jgi:hypothetical protein
MSEKRTETSIGVSLLVAVLAVVTLVLALLVVAALRPALPDDTPTATAQVVKVVNSSPKFGINSIEVAYSLPDGRRVTARTTHFRSEDTSVGRQVQIRYDPDHTDRVVVVGANESWSSRWIYVIVAGLAELLVLVAVLRGYQRRGKRGS